MKKSKVIDIFKSLSPEEFKRFREYVHSPFHNKNKNIIRLLEILKKYFPEFPEEKIKKEKIFVKLFPGKKYNDVVMRIQISDLLKLAEEFLSYIGFKRKQFDEIKFLMRELTWRNLDSLYRSKLKMAEKLLDEAEKSKIDVFHFHDRYELETQVIDMLIARDKQSQSASRVMKQGEYLLSFFIAGILNIADELLTQKDVLNITFDFNLVEEAVKCFDFQKVIEYMKANNFRYVPIISIYYYMYLTHTDPKENKNYFELKRLIGENFGSFSHNEKVNLLIILENSCLTQSLQGQQKSKELMYIYRKMLDHKLYIHSGEEYFQINLFRNMFYTAIIINDLKWASEFLKKHMHELSPDQRDDMYHFSNAVLSFEKRDFDKALAEITRVNLKFFVYKFDVRLLMLKIYYEQGAFESALSIIDTFTHFLANNKTVSETDKVRFGKFLKILNTLIRIRTGAASLSDFDLRKEVINTSILNSRQWLLEKAEDLYRLQ